MAGEGEGIVAPSSRVETLVYGDSAGGSSMSGEIRRRGRGGRGGRGGRKIEFTHKAHDGCKGVANYHF